MNFVVIHAGTLQLNAMHAGTRLDTHIFQCSSCAVIKSLTTRSLNCFRTTFLQPSQPTQT